MVTLCFLDLWVSYLTVKRQPEIFKTSIDDAAIGGKAAGAAGRAPDSDKKGAKDVKKGKTANKKK